MAYKRESTAGGYDYTFVQPIADKYKCTICNKVQREAMIISCCCIHFCKSCLHRRWQLKGKKCPKCNATGFDSFVNREQIQEIKSKEILCSKVDMGCKWQGKLGDLKTHLDGTCDYVTVSCPKKCKENMLRKDLNNHQRVDCFLRPHKCKYCGLEGTYHSLTGECGRHGPCNKHSNHYDRCEEYPLKCPNKCPEKEIRRKNIKSHREQCPLEPVACPLKELGCPVNGVRRDLKAHLDDSCQLHLTLMTAAFKKLQERVAELEETVPRSPFEAFIASYPYGQRRRRYTHRHSPDDDVLDGDSHNDEKKRNARCCFD